MSVITIQFTLDDNDNVVDIQPGYGWDYFQMQSVVMAMPQMFRSVLKGTRYTQPQKENADGGSVAAGD